MQNVLISIEDNAVDKVMYLLKNLSDVKIVERPDKQSNEDLSFLDNEIDRGLKSGKSSNTHK